MFLKHALRPWHLSRSCPMLWSLHTWLKKPPCSDRFPTLSTALPESGCFPSRAQFFTQGPTLGPSCAAGAWRPLIYSQSWSVRPSAFAARPPQHSRRARGPARGAVLRVRVRARVTWGRRLPPTVCAVLSFPTHVRVSVDLHAPLWERG